MEIETGTELVLARIVDGVGVVTLHRPERRNALHPDMYRAVPEVLDHFETDAAVRCIMITGTGSAFCAGGDVVGGRRPVEATPTGEPTVEPTVEQRAEVLTDQARMVVQLHRSEKVTLAALPGPAVGAGIAIALAADLRIAARSTRFVPGWGALGFSGDFGGTWFLTRYLGPSRALEFLVEDEAMDVDEAHRLGLVNRVVADDDLPAAALDWARRIAAKPHTAQRYVKQNVRQAETLGLEAALPLESERMVRCSETDEHREAVAQWLAAARAKQAGEEQS
jgi:2-(1,2-epoxy-1,2-dihydrophenyl)acetyl-CoA isomerase